MALGDVRGGEAGLRAAAAAAAQELRQKAQQDAVFVVHFWAAWCEPCAHMDTVLESLATASSTPALRFVGLRCEAEEEGDVSESYAVEAVPTFVALRLTGAGGDGLEELGRVEGASPGELSLLVERIAAREEYGRRAAAPEGGAGPQEDLHTRLTALVKRERVMLFMKGRPSEPRCGFSRKVADALVSCYGADAASGDVDALFGNFDILGDQEVRQGLKEFSKWPTFPQLYVDGELIGGCDIVLEMHEAGELQELVAA